MCACMFVYGLTGVALGGLKFTILLQPPVCWSIGVCHHLCRIWLEWLQIDVNCESAHSSLSISQGSTWHKWNGNSTVQSVTPQTCVDFSAHFLFLLWKEKDFTISEDLCIVIKIQNWYLKILQNIFTFTFSGVWVYMCMSLNAHVMALVRMFEGCLWELIPFLYHVHPGIDWTEVIRLRGILTHWATFPVPQNCHRIFCLMFLR